MDLRSKMRARLPVNAGRWYEIKSQGDKAVVRIYNEIGYFGVSAEEFASDLDGITASEIEVQINSPGGEVFGGLAIYNALRMHPAHVTTRVDGIAASAASVIVQAGDHRVMLGGAQMMIHEAWGLAVGPSADLREFADLLDKQSDIMAKLYADRSGGDVAEIRQMMAAETFLTDQEAVDAGLADEVVNPDRKDTAGKSSAKWTSDDLQALAAEIQKLGPLIPSAGEREDPTSVPAGEPDALDPELASRLLATLTLNKETPHE